MFPSCLQRYQRHSAWSLSAANYMSTFMKKTAALCALPPPVTSLSSFPLVRRPHPRLHDGGAATCDCRVALACPQTATKTRSVAAIPESTAPRCSRARFCQITRVCLYPHAAEPLQKTLRCTATPTLASNCWVCLPNAVARTIPSN